MMSDARVVLEDDSLRVDLPGESPLLSGIHRIYFLNVLGFEPSTEPLGYVITSHPSALILLLNILDYFQEQKLKPEFNDRAQRTLERFRNASSDLAQGAEAGRAIKSGPP